jgi:hypothetical protein
MPLVQPNKQYGDQKTLDDLNRAANPLKQGNADLVPTPKNPVGRPPGSASTPTAQPGAAPVSPLPPEHIALMEDAARAVRVSDVGKQIAADPLAGPWLRLYAQRAEQDAADKLRQVKELTPDYEVG